MTKRHKLLRNPIKEHTNLVILLKCHLRIFRGVFLTEVQIEEDAKRNQEMRNLDIRDQQRQAPRAERQLYPRIEPNINEIIEDQVNKRFQRLLDTQQQIENHIKIQNIDVDTSPRKDNS